MFFRAFKSILKCQRIKKYKPSTNFYRISSATTDQFRRKRSNSCDITTSHSFAKFESITSHRTSTDSQRRCSSLKTCRNIINNSHRIPRLDPTTNSTIPKSLSAIDNSSPWHLRKSYNVR